MISSPTKVDYRKAPLKGDHRLGIFTIASKDIVLGYTVRWLMLGNVRSQTP